MINISQRNKSEVTRANSPWILFTSCIVETQRLLHLTPLNYSFLSPSFPTSFHLSPHAGLFSVFDINCSPPYSLANKLHNCPNSIINYHWLDLYLHVAVCKFPSGTGNISPIFPLGSRVKKVLTGSEKPLLWIKICAFGNNFGKSLSFPKNLKTGSRACWV